MSSNCYKQTKFSVNFNAFNILLKLCNRPAKLKFFGGYSKPVFLDQIADTVSTSINFLVLYVTVKVS